jgi:hypothetical protein
MGNGSLNSMLDYYPGRGFFNLALEVGAKHTTTNHTTMLNFCLRNLAQE